MCVCIIYLCDRFVVWLIIYLFFVQFLSKCVVGASLEEAEEEEDNASIASSILDGPKEGCYEVVGTLKNREKPKPDFVRELILVSDRFHEEYVCGTDKWDRQRICANTFGMLL